jgi:hypothetical protein
MPLLDHFHPPLRDCRDWHGFHHGWATSLSSALNERLPPDYYAQPNIQYGIEIDVATLEHRAAPDAGRPAQGPVPDWSPPAPAFTLPLPLLTDLVEVQVFRSLGGPQLVGAIELVSPANKDRPDHRDAFVNKCASYLQRGVGLIIVDIVTERRANLHDALLARLTNGEAPPPMNQPLYAAAYHPVEREQAPHFDIWPATLALGAPLPTLPLWIGDGLSVPVDLESAYERTCREQRIPPGGFGANGAG